MFYMYILKSKKDGELYIGYTADLRRRLTEHNQGESFSTNYRRPFELVYYEAYRNKHEAYHREQNLKLHARAFAQLKRRIKISLEAE